MPGMNMLVGNVYIINSQMGGASLIVSNTSAWPQNAFIESVAFLAGNSLSTVQLSFLSNTTNVAFTISPRLPVGAVGDTIVIPVGGVRFEELTASSLVNGTAWIYFS